MDFIPWEFLPAWLGGIVLVIFGVYKIIASPMYSWEQALGITCIFAGIGLIVWDLRKASSKNVDATTSYKQKLK